MGKAKRMAAEEERRHKRLIAIANMELKSQRKIKLTYINKMIHRIRERQFRCGEYITINFVPPKCQQLLEILQEDSERLKVYSSLPDFLNEINSQNILLRP